MHDHGNTHTTNLVFNRLDFRMVKTPTGRKALETQGSRGILKIPGNQELEQRWLNDDPSLNTPGGDGSTNLREDGTGRMAPSQVTRTLLTSWRWRVAGHGSGHTTQTSWVIGVRG